MTRAVNFTRHSNKTWGNIAGPRTLIGPTCWIWLLKHFFWLLNVAYVGLIRLLIQPVVTHHGSHVHRAVIGLLSFALTHFTFVLDFRRLKTSVFGWNLYFSSTLNFWIAYFSCNDDLVRKIRDHFSECQLGTYLKSPNWCLDSSRPTVYRTLSEKLLCTMYHYLF